MKPRLPEIRSRIDHVPHLSPGQVWVLGAVSFAAALGGSGFIFEWIGKHPLSGHAGHTRPASIQPKPAAVEPMAVGGQRVH